MPNLSTLLSIVARGTVFRLVGYSYEDVIGSVDSFRVAHLTCDMIQKRRVVVTSSIGSSASSNQRPAPTRIASPSSSLSTIAYLCRIALCLPLRSLSNNRGPLSFHDVLEQFLSRRINIHKYLHFLD